MNMILSVLEITLYKKDMKEEGMNSMKRYFTSEKVVFDADIFIDRQRIFSNKS